MSKNTIVFDSGMLDPIKHYIKIDSLGNVISGWSSAVYPDIDPTGAICINENGSYQFRLSSTGDDNPNLFDESGNPLYKWDNGGIIPNLQLEEDG